MPFPRGLRLSREVVPGKMLKKKSAASHDLAFRCCLVFLILGRALYESWFASFQCAVKYPIAVLRRFWTHLSSRRIITGSSFTQMRITVMPKLFGHDLSGGRENAIMIVEFR